MSCSVINNESLYEILSPILNSVSIDDIGIKDAKLKYELTFENTTDTYQLDRFDLEAKGFKIDSLANIRRNFLYTDEFKVSANQINAELQSQHHVVTIGQMAMSTMDKRFQLKDVSLTPLSGGRNFNQLKGHIDSLTIDGMHLDTGLSIDRLSIESPDVEYVKNIRQRVVPVGLKKNVNVLDSLDAVTNILDYLTIKHITLTNGSIAYRDNFAKIKQTYRIGKLDFVMSGFIMNKNTILNPEQLFDYSAFNLKFNNFDNILPDGAHRLKIKKANIASVGGTLSMEGIRLEPLEKWKGDTPSSQFEADIPHIEANGINFEHILRKGDLIEGDKIKILSPHLNIVKLTASDSNVADKSGTGINLSNIAINHFDVIGLNVNVEDKTNGNKTSVTLNGLQLDTFSWYPQKSINIGLLNLDRPLVSVINGLRDGTSSHSNNIVWNHEEVNIGKISIGQPIFTYKHPNIAMNLNVEKFGLSALKWNNKIFKITDVIVVNPDIQIDAIAHGKGEIRHNLSSTDDLYKLLGRLSNEINLGKFSLTNANVSYQKIIDKEIDANQRINQLNIEVEKFKADNVNRVASVGELNFDTKNLQIPMADGFYNLKIGELEFASKNSVLEVNKLHFESIYPKEEFASKHPKGKDWFDVTAGHIALSGVDIPAYLFDKKLNANLLEVKDVVLSNLKNQKIKIQHNIMPMIYENLQKFPVELTIDSTRVTNFSVIYEELSKNGITPGVLSFTDMNGSVKRLTNVETEPNQFMTLNADGRLMGTGYFTAEWKIPVSSQNNHFSLKGHLHEFNLRDLNRLLTHMAPAEVTSGIAKDTKFEIEASSLGGNVKLDFQYHNLKVSIYNDIDDKSPKKFITSIVNKVIKKNNPNSRWSRPRISDITIVRDPYHSTFNYFWQFLQPALIESVGITKNKQNFALRVLHFVSKVKKIFHHPKKTQETPTSEHEH